MLPNGIVTSSARDSKGIRDKSLILHKEHENEAFTHIVAPSASHPVAPSIGLAPSARGFHRAALGVVARPAQDAGSARMTLDQGEQTMRNFLEVSAKFLSVVALASSAAFAQEPGPDALIKTIADEVIAAI